MSGVREIRVEHVRADQSAKRPADKFCRSSRGGRRPALRFLQGADPHTTQHAAAQGNTTVLTTDHDGIAAREHLHLDPLVKTDTPEMLGPFAAVIQRNHPITHPARAVLQTECHLPNHKLLYLRLSLKDGSRQSILAGDPVLLTWLPAIPARRAGRTAQRDKGLYRI